MDKLLAGWRVMGHTQPFRVPNRPSEVLKFIHSSKRQPLANFRSEQLIRDEVKWEDTNRTFIGGYMLGNRIGGLIPRMPIVGFDSRTPTQGPGMTSLQGLLGFDASRGI